MPSRYYLPDAYRIIIDKDSYGLESVPVGDVQAAADFLNQRLRGYRIKAEVTEAVVESPEGQPQKTAILALSLERTAKKNKARKARKRR